MQTEFGLFPFGRPNTIRPARFAAVKPQATIVGVYPSAWHIAWKAPESSRCEDRVGSVKALAVDVEPTVFWDGASDDFGIRLAKWRDDVGFIEGDNPGQHGHISLKSPFSNGSSGRKVVTNYLHPLGLDENSVAFTDICPVFYVKHTNNTTNGHKREQGDAIRQEYDSIASYMSLSKSTLPSRPSNSQVPEIAAKIFASRLIHDLNHASSDLVITLGAEVWHAFLLIPELYAKPPVSQFNELYGSHYGSTGEVFVGGRRVTWLPLIHPGLINGNLLAIQHEFIEHKRTTVGWNNLHANWMNGNVGQRKVSA